MLCADPVTGNISANGGSVSGTGIAVDVGSYPSVSLFAHNGELLVYANLLNFFNLFIHFFLYGSYFNFTYSLEVHSDGFCWNSEPNNKQPSRKTTLLNCNLEI